MEACRKMWQVQLEGQIIVKTNLGLAGPLEVGTEIGGGRSVGDVLSFPDNEGGGVLENVGGPAHGPNMQLIELNRTNLGLAGPLEEVGTEIGGGSSVGDIRSFPAEGGGMSENMAGPARGPWIPIGEKPL